jgi:aminoglycoside 3-N-acetyltransferase
LRSAGLQAEGPVGNAHARLFRSRDVVQLAVERLLREPLLFLHPAAEGCEDCDEARATVPA